MGMICSTHGKPVEDLKEREHLGNLGIGGRIMLNWIFRKCRWD
jgi:hypothetical protein